MYVNWTFRALWGANQAAALINVSLSPTSNLLTTTTTIRVFNLEYLVSVWYVLAELLAKSICYQEQTKLKLSEFLLLATFLYRYIRNILCNSETLSLKSVFQFYWQTFVQPHHFSCQHSIGPRLWFW